MNRLSSRLLFWTPRILGIAFILFISMFALDVFSEHDTAWKLAMHLFMHLVPSFILIGILVLAWRWEWVGTVAFAGLATFYALTTLKHPDWIMGISGPQYLLALLFLINWVLHDELRRKNQTRS